MDLSFFGKKTSKLVQLYGAFGEQVKAGLSTLLTHFPKTENDVNKLSELENPVHPHESRADDIRRDIERTMYEGSLLPQSRADILSLLETWDRILSKSEDIMEYFALKEIKIPKDFFPRFKEVLEESVAAAEKLTDLALMLFEDTEQIMNEINLVDEMESKVDKLERRLIRDLFATPTLSLAEKMLLADFVHDIASLSDIAEHAADRLQLIIIRRRV